MAISRELAQVTARLDWLVHTDSLTGLLNRKGMERAIMDELARCRRDGTDLLILLVDLDDFSRINATLGHGVGDLVLVARGPAHHRVGPASRTGSAAAAPTASWSCCRRPTWPRARSSPRRSAWPSAAT